MTNWSSGNSNCAQSGGNGGSVRPLQEPWLWARLTPMRGMRGLGCL